MKPTPAQLRKLERLRKAHLAARATYEEFARSLPFCEHPEDQRSDFPWHHGYGRYVDGEHCSMCGQYRAWKGSGEWRDEAPRLRSLNHDD